jgi:YidC/Oxa1 family membrane protein insertase
MGWEGTLPYLILPVFLVISQFVSMQLMQPKTQDPQQQQANVVLKLLPLMIGWFSLNVPSALCIYWVVNNIVTTATTVLIRNSMPDPVAMESSGAAAVSAPPPTQSVFSSPPSREKPSGFASSAVVDDNEVKPITSTAIDAEVVTKEAAVETPEPEETPVASGEGMTSSSSAPKSKKVR